MKCIILFDGVCNLCNGWVRLIIRYDSKDVFRFASLQSEEGKKLIAQSAAESSDSVILVADGKYYFKSSAALKIFCRMNGAWKLMRVFFIVPKFLRDAVYDFIARYRYRWFGKRASCMVPDEKRHVGSGE